MTRRYWLGTFGPVPVSLVLVDLHLYTFTYGSSNCAPGTYVTKPIDIVPVERYLRTYITYESSTNGSGTFDHSTYEPFLSVLLHVPCRMSRCQLLICDSNTM